MYDNYPITGVGGAESTRRIGIAESSFSELVNATEHFLLLMWYAEADYYGSRFSRIQQRVDSCNCWNYKLIKELLAITYSSSYTHSMVMLCAICAMMGGGYRKGFDCVSRAFSQVMPILNMWFIAPATLRTTQGVALLRAVLWLMNSSRSKHSFYLYLTIFTNTL